MTSIDRLHASRVSSGEVAPALAAPNGPTSLLIPDLKATNPAKSVTVDSPYAPADAKDHLARIGHMVPPQQGACDRCGLGSKLAAYNRAHPERAPVKLFSHDHNWNIAPETRKVLDGARPWIDAIAYNGCGGDPTDHLKNVAKAFPNLPVYFTEISGFYGGQSSPADDLKWDARNARLGPLQVGARACLTWNIALDGKNGPLNGGVDFLRAFLKVNAANDIVANQEYFRLGVASRNVKQGAVRVGVTTSAPLDCAAFENPDS